MKPQSLKKQLIQILGVFLLQQASHAAVVVTGVTATATSNYPTANTDVSFLVNNSGLSVADDVTATHSTFGSGPVGWHSQNGVVNDESITLDLHGTYDLAEIYLWQMNQTSALGRGVRQFDLLVSTDGGFNYTEVVSDLTLLQALNNGPIGAQSFALNQSGVTHVRIGIDSSWNGTTNDYVGLNEVKFTAVPEPTAALLGSLGALSLLRRRRNS